MIALRWIVVAGLALSLGGCSGSDSEEQAADARPTPNIVLILADDLGWTGTSVQLDPERPDSRSDFYQTPNLERLAAKGMRFSNAYAPHPNCSPTRLTIQTGKSPAQLRMTDIINRNSGPFYEGLPLIPPAHINALPDGETTIAELLKQDRPEYRTAHFGKWHLAGGGPGRHGYDEHSGETSNREGQAEAPDPKRTFSVTDQAVAFLEASREQQRPFLMQVSYYAVHLPIRALPETIAKYQQSEPGQRHNHPGHAAMTEDLDTGVGRLLEAIDRLGLAEDTWVIFTSDNGSYTRAGETQVTTNEPLHGEKASTWEGGIRVPLIVRGPGVTADSVSGAVVSGIDFYPTVRQILGVEAPLPAGVEGGSLLPVLTGGATAVERPHRGLTWHFPHYQVDKGNRPMTSLRLGDYKLIRFYETGESALYDLAVDLGEERDLSGELPDKAAELTAALDDYLEAVDAPLPTPNPDHRP